MKNKPLVVVLIIVAVLAGILWLGSEKQTQNPTIEAEFRNAQSGQSITVSFDNNAQTATLNGLGYENLVFNQAISASGARYVNENRGLVLWNKGDDITLYDAEDNPIFTGTTGEGQEETAAVRQSIIGSTWVWQETRYADGRVMEPKTSGVFTVVFNQEGQVNGTTDCNNFFGPYTAGAGNSLVFGALASTLKYCEGSQENDFRKDISEINRYYFAAENQLVLTNQTSSVSIFFTKR